MAEVIDGPNGVDDRLPLDLVFQEYRRHYPRGRIPLELESQGGWSRVDQGDLWQFRLIYWIQGKTEPFVLFEADLNKRNLDLRVSRAEDPAPIWNRGLQKKGEGWERYENQQ